MKHWPYIQWTHHVCTLFLHKTKMKLSLVTMPPLLILPVRLLFERRPVFCPSCLRCHMKRRSPGEGRSPWPPHPPLFHTMPHRFSDATDGSGLLSRKMQFSHPKEDGLDSDPSWLRKGQSWMSRCLPSSDI